MKITIYHIVVCIILTQIVQSQIGIGTKNPKGIFHIDPNQNNDINSDEENIYSDDFIITNDGKLGIGTINIDQSSKLEINIEKLSDGFKKGFLPPRLSLKSHNDIETIKNPSKGLLVYNLGEKKEFDYKGLIFWDGNEWLNINGKSLYKGNIEVLVCNDAKLSPSQFKAGTNYYGILKIPYKNGNGGYYNKQRITLSNNLTAELPSGNYDVGDGFIQYIISGQPNNNSNENYHSIFEIDKKQCDVKFGENYDISVGDLKILKYEINAESVGWLSDLLPGTNLFLLDNEILIEPYFSKSSNLAPTTGQQNPSVELRLVNISFTKNKIIWFVSDAGLHSQSASNHAIPISKIGQKGYLTMDQLDLYWGANMTKDSTPSTNTALGNVFLEPLRADILYNNKWFQLEYFGIVDNLNDTDPTNNKRVIYLTVKRLY